MFLGVNKADDSEGKRELPILINKYIYRVGAAQILRSE
jgi:hypothetical protein